LRPFIIIFLLVLSSSVFAVDFYPRGDIVGQNYNITNFTRITAGIFTYVNGTPIGGLTEETDPLFKVGYVGLNTNISNRLLISSFQADNSSLWAAVNARLLITGFQGDNSSIHARINILNSSLISEASVRSSVDASLVSNLSTESNTRSSQVSALYLNISSVNNSAVKINSNANISLNWSKLINFPTACPAGTAITDLGSVVTCTAFLQTDGSGGWVNNTQNTSTVLQVVVGNSNQNIGGRLKLWTDGVEQTSLWFQESTGLAGVNVTYDPIVNKLFFKDLSDGNVLMVLDRDTDAVNISLLNVPQICLAGVCQTSWPAGGGVGGGWINTTQYTTTSLDVNITGNLTLGAGGVILDIRNISADLIFNTSLTARFTKNLSADNLKVANCDLKADPVSGQIYCGTDTGGAGLNFNLFNITYHTQTVTLPKNSTSHYTRLQNLSFALPSSGAASIECLLYVSSAASSTGPWFLVNITGVGAHRTSVVMVQNASNNPETFQTTNLLSGNRVEAIKTYNESPSVGDFYLMRVYHDGSRSSAGEFSIWLATEVAGSGVSVFSRSQCRGYTY